MWGEIHTFILAQENSFAILLSGVHFWRGKDSLNVPLHFLRLMMSTD